MCRYATGPNSHYVCLPCRSAFKRSPRPEREHPCPRCGRPMTDAGFDLAMPRRRDDAGWRTLAAVLRSGLTFHSCGCEGPGFRPRSWAEVRERQLAAEQLGVPEREALARWDPWREEREPGAAARPGRPTGRRGS
ncbi:hypothetical protein ACTWP5_01230 [Streptomyces sp. 4N509B]|uniref:hypothetical protein n=1 Tax=Streptomyces sp. 4N509B TaxID=3457413 RepID=UPI003FD6A278